MASANKYNFPAAKKGDTYNDVEFTLSLNSIPQNLTGASIKMCLAEANSNIKSAEYTTANGKIIITDASGGVFKTNIGIIKIAAKVYQYDIEITFADSVVKTWIEGTFTVENDISR